MGFFYGDCMEYREFADNLLELIKSLHSCPEERLIKRLDQIELCIEVFLLILPED